MWPSARSAGIPEARRLWRRRWTCASSGAVCPRERHQPPHHQPDDGAHRLQAHRLPPDFERNRYIYTRYADDIYISSRYDFDPRRLTRHINSVLEEFHATFRLNPEKNPIQFPGGRELHFRRKLNKDNNISIGYERKKAFRSWLNNYLSDRKESIPTPAEELYKLGGYISYYRSSNRSGWTRSWTATANGLGWTSTPVLRRI